MFKKLSQVKKMNDLLISNTQNISVKLASPHWIRRKSLGIKKHRIWSISSSLTKLNEKDKIREFSCWSCGRRHTGHPLFYNRQLTSYDNHHKLNLFFLQYCSYQRYPSLKTLLVMPWFGESKFLRGIEDKSWHRALALCSKSGAYCDRT